MKFIKNHIIFSLALLTTFSGYTAFASSSAAEGSHNPAETLLWISVILIVAKVSGLVERFGQPSVLGELVAGVIIGNLSLIGISTFEVIKVDGIIQFLSELGVIILLFQIGLESNLTQIKSVGVPALKVALLGVIIPFCLGLFLIGPWLLPEASTQTHLFLAATLTATSVGITARVFKDLKKLNTKEAQIILGAAVIDDIIGLIILAVVSALVTTGTVSVGAVSLITFKAFAFLIGAIVIGQLIAPKLGEWFSKIHTGTGMKFTLAVCFAFFFSYVASVIGLAPIVGAFAAGLILDTVHFKFFRNPLITEDITKEIKNLPAEQKLGIEKVLDRHSEKHIEDLIEPLSYLVVPLFFIYTGMSVNLSALADTSVIAIALIITVVAILGKLVSGLVAGKGVNKWIVGAGMVPRGEVGLIFATIGQNLGVIDEKLFSAIVIMVILTTLITPLVLALLIKKQDRAQTA